MPRRRVLLLLPWVANLSSGGPHQAHAQSGTGSPPLGQPGSPGTAGGVGRAGGNGAGPGQPGTEGGAGGAGSNTNTTEGAAIPKRTAPPL